jgi:thiamine pyrophosphate-dependent acetolactate synthase large subunit-like protein
MSPAKISDVTNGGLYLLVTPDNTRPGNATTKLWADGLPLPQSSEKPTPSALAATARMARSRSPSRGARLHGLWLDLVIGIGTRLELPGWRWSYRPDGQKSIRIDIDPVEMRRYPPDVAVVSGSKAGTHDLLASPGQRDYGSQLDGWSAFPLQRPRHWKRSEACSRNRPI